MGTGVDVGTGTGVGDVFCDGASVAVGVAVAFGAAPSFGTNDELDPPELPQAVSEIAAIAVTAAALSRFFIVILPL